MKHRLGRKNSLGFLVVVATGLALLWWGASSTFGQKDAAPSDRPQPPKGYFDEKMPEGFKRVPFPARPTAQAIEAGKRVYFTKCVWCHGVDGAGDGPAADRLWPRPRNFNQGTFKIRHTASGELPLIDVDLFLTVTHGLPGSAMPSWNGILTEEQRRNVLAFITSQLVKDRRFDDTETETFTVLQLDQLKPIPPTPESVAMGKQLFQEKKCLECHGIDGRGDGNPLNLKDDWGFPIQPRNLHKCWQIRGTRGDPYSPKNIFRTFSTGLNGTPMPSFADNMTVEERWHLANFVISLCERDEKGQPLEIDPLRDAPRINPVISSRYVEGAIPDDPDSPAWQSAPRRWIAMGGQITHAPRNFVNRIDDLWVQSLYNDKDVSFLLRWDDRIKSVAKSAPPFKPVEVNLGKYGVVDPPPETGEAGSLAAKQNTYKVYHDAVAIQFPVTWQGGQERPLHPPYFWGEPSQPVDILRWSADGTLAAYKGTGWDRDLEERPFSKQARVLTARWENGRWTVILVRPLKGESSDDATLTVGSLIPTVFFAWDGHNGDAGRKMAVSPYYYTILQPKAGDIRDLTVPFPRRIHPNPPLAFRVKDASYSAQSSRNPFRVNQAGQYDPGFAARVLPEDGPGHLIQPTANPWDASVEGYLKYVREGGKVFFQNCHFCHGDNLNGRGLWSYASSPRPSDFTGPAKLSQNEVFYTFWRVATGASGAGPDWLLRDTSTMPAMEEFLTPDEIWKAVLFSHWHTDALPKCPSNRDGAAPVSVC